MTELDQETQAAIRREVQKQLASLPQSAAGQPIRASEYDFKCEPANIYPGDGWEFVALAGVGINIILVWKMSRIRQAELKIAPIMPLR